MTYLLDTNQCIRYLNAESPRLRQRIDSAGALAVCSVVKAESFFGAMKCHTPDPAGADQVDERRRRPYVAGGLGDAVRLVANAILAPK